jgi:hypothetical protein
MTCFHYIVLHGWGQILNRKFYYKFVTRIKIVGKSVLAGRCDVHTSEFKPDVSSLLLGNVIKVTKVFKARPTNKIFF